MAQEPLAVSAIRCWEVATLVRRGRIALDRDVRSWISGALAGDPPVEAVSVGPDVAVRAGELDERFPGDSADRIILATAQTLGCRLITRDRRIRRYAPGATLWD